MRVGVIGAGVMGSGIAQTTATAGIETRCYDPDPAALERANEAVRTGRYGVERGVERGKISDDEALAALAHLSFTEDFDEAADQVRLKPAFVLRSSATFRSFFLACHLLPQLVPDLISSHQECQRPPFQPIHGTAFVFLGATQRIKRVQFGVPELLRFDWRQQEGDVMITGVDQ